MQANVIEVKESFVQKAYLYILRLLNFLYVYCGIKDKKKFWGIVYDSKTKQPIDPAVVKVVRADSSMEVHTCFTDIAGRYGFLIDPGTYKIIAKKENYEFPSKLCPGTSDGVFSELYHGEFFEVKGDSEVVAPNIPMDPKIDDWNQQAKQKYIKTHPFFEKAVKWAIGFAYWTAFLVSLIFVVKNFLQTEEFVFSIFVFVFLGLLSFLAISWFLPDVRLYAKVKDLKTNSAVQGVFLEIVNPIVETAVLGKATTNKEGKFFLRASRGSYILNFSMFDETGAKIFLCALPVRVHAEGLVNGTFYIDIYSKLNS